MGNNKRLQLGQTTEAERIKYLEMSLALCKEPVTIHKIIRMYDRILIQGGALSVEDIVEVDFSFENENSKENNTA